MTSLRRLIIALLPHAPKTKAGSKASRLRARVTRLTAIGRRPALAARARRVLILFAGNGGLSRLPDGPGAADIAATLFERDARVVAAILRHTRALRDAGWTSRRADLADDAHAFVRGCLAFLARDFATAATAFAAVARHHPTGDDGAVAAEILRFVTNAGLTDPAMVESLRRPLAPPVGTGQVLVVVQPSIEVPTSIMLAAGRPCTVIETPPGRGDVGGTRLVTVTIDDTFQTTGHGRALRAAFDRIAATFAGEIAARLGLKTAVDAIADVLHARCLTAWFFARETERLIAATRPERVLVVAAQASFVTAVRNACGRTACDVAWIARPRLDDDLFCYWPSPQIVSLRRTLASGDWPRIGGLPRHRVPVGATVLAGDIRSPEDESRLVLLAETVPAGTDLLLLLSGVGEHGPALARRCAIGERDVRFVDADASARGRCEPDLDLVRRAGDAGKAVASRLDLPSKLRAAGRTFLGSVMVPTLADAPEFEQAVSLLRLVDRAGGVNLVMSSPRGRTLWLEILAARARMIGDQSKSAAAGTKGRLTEFAKATDPVARLHHLVRQAGQAKTTGSRARQVLIDQAIRQAIPRPLLPTLPIAALPALFEAAAESFSALQPLVSALSGHLCRYRHYACHGDDFGFVRAVLAFARQDHRTARREFAAWAERHPETTSGAAATEVCRFIDIWGLEQSKVVSSLRDPLSTTGRNGDEHWLIVIDPGATRSLPQPIPAHRRITVLASSSEIPPSIGGHLEAVHVVDAIFASSKRGHHLREKFNLYTKRFGENFASTPPYLGTDSLVADVLHARALNDWYHLNEAAALAREITFDRVIVLTDRPAFFSAIDDIILCRAGHAEAAWIAAPRIERDRLAFWPSPAEIAACRRARSGAIVLGPRCRAVDTTRRELILAANLENETDVARCAEALSRLRPDVGVLALIDGPLATSACARRFVAIRPDRIGVVHATDFVGRRCNRETLVAARKAAEVAKGRRGRLFGLEGRKRRALIEHFFVPTLITAPEFERTIDLLDWLVKRNLPVAVVGPRSGALPSWLQVVLRGESPSALAHFSRHLSTSMVPTSSEIEPDAATAPKRLLPSGFGTLVAVEAAERRPRNFEEMIAGRTNLTVAGPEAPKSLVAARFALCRAAIERGPNRERAQRVCLMLVRRHGSKLTDLPETLYPQLFEDVAFQLAPTRKLCDDLAGWRPRSREARTDTIFAFTRGLLAFYRQDYATARNEFETCTTAHPTTRSALAACGFLSFLSTYPLHDPEYLELRRSSGSLAMKPFARKSILILSEGTIDDIETTFSDVPADCRVTVIVRYMFDLTRKPKPGWEFVFMPRNMWYLPEGKALHKRLEALCDDAATAIGRAAPTLAACPFGIKAHLVDSSLLDFWMLEKLGELLKQKHFDRVVVLTRRLSFYKTIREIVRNHSWTMKVKLHILSGPRIDKPPNFVYWPEQAILKAPFFARMLKRRLPKRAKRAPPVPVLPTLRNPLADADAPVLLAWSIGDKNYDLSLKRVAESALRFRSLVVVTLGGNEAKIAATRTMLEAMAAEADRDLVFVHYNSFLREGRYRHTVVRAATRATASLAPPRRRMRSDDAPEIDPFRRNDLPDGFVDDFTIGAFDATMQWLEVLCRTNHRPAYAVTCPGRLPFLAAIAESLQSRGIPCVDLHLYFVGDAARQMPTPQHYYATLDTMVARFVTNYWQVPAENVVRVGYLWGDPTEGYDIAQPFERREGEFLVVYASQPIHVDIAAPFADSILKIIAEFPDVRLLVKPHPNDEKASLEWIERRIGELNLGERAEIMPFKSPIGPMLDAADLVVTRTSNVALEAAFRYKSVVRGIMYDLSLPPTSLDVPYAINARDHESFESALRTMISDPEARARQREAQQQYIEENPSLVDIKGNIRLVDFMEEQVARRASPKMDR